ncbi:MAG: sulfatase-like hydrolase/transferase [Gammaproteobacteria bacterium]|nr:sulfatase-like hydrolase/transferase [Gammaproteobacteria bacterium]
MHAHKLLLFRLTYLTIFWIVAQIIFFMIHYHVAGLMDSLASSPMRSALWKPVVLLPLLQFIVLQLLAYMVFVAFIYFLTISINAFTKRSHSTLQMLGISLWILSIISLLMMNQALYPHSFFAIFPQLSSHSIFMYFVILSLGLFFAVLTLLAYYACLRMKQYRLLGLFFLLLSVIPILDLFNSSLTGSSSPSSKPHIIFIGLDSLRPDYVHFYNKSAQPTNAFDQFLKTSQVFDTAYTPLARTYPAWMAILTGRYPKENHARINLSDADAVLKNTLLPRQLQLAGYQTLYATDEPRFNDITEAYGFDQVIGPKSGAAEFLIATLSDFPLSNLLLRLSISRYLFPYQYANRAVSHTYEPNDFLNMLARQIVKEPNKPLFLALHLCLAHWPYTWASSALNENALSALRYQASVNKLDEQFGKLLIFLEKAHLLENSMVVVFSDHGVTLGLPNDRIINQHSFQGDPAQIKLLPIYQRHDTATALSNYALDTSYGQGTDILSLKQYRIVLGFKMFGMNLPGKRLLQIASLIDIAPTVRAYLHLAPVPAASGLSFYPYFFNKFSHPIRPLFIETADTLADITTENIMVEKVFRNSINAYLLNSRTGFLFVNPEAMAAMIRAKERAIFTKDWLLARYPANTKLKLVKKPHSSHLILESVLTPPVYVLVNLKTMAWQLGQLHSLIKNPETQSLAQQFTAFYGSEI